MLYHSYLLNKSFLKELNESKKNPKVLDFLKNLCQIDDVLHLYFKKCVCVWPMTSLLIIYGSL